MQLTLLKNVFFASVLGLAGLWLLSLESGAFAGDFWRTRRTLVLGTGVLAFGLMSVGVILAVRPVWFETPLGGLDKFYRLHKWLGISAFTFAVCSLGLSVGTILDLLFRSVRFATPPVTHRRCIRGV